ncbi:MAG: hypothetical protein P4M14_12985 [Gammaproteobacteria bacterium]|nr:hypothetical protein [Gammaproteobacteria bacterium]
MVSLSMAFSPDLHLHLYNDKDNQESLPESIADTIHSFFCLSDTLGLLKLGLTHFDVPLPTSVAFWQRFSHGFIAEVCKQNGSNEKPTPTVSCLWMRCLV